MYPEFRIPFDPIECMENNRAYLRRMLNIHSEAKWEARARDIPGSSSVNQEQRATSEACPGDQTRWAVQDAIALMKTLQGEIPALKHDWREFIYTDGSVLPKDQKQKGPGIGAAVHIPANLLTCARP